MDILQIIRSVKRHPKYDKVGMVLYHNGVVRGFSRNGSKIKSLKVEVDYKILNKIITKYKKRRGIIEIIVNIDDTRVLSVGEDVMFLAVAGDIRENVIATLTDTLNEVKSKVTRKTENLDLSD